MAHSGVIHTTDRALKNTLNTKASNLATDNEDNMHPVYVPYACFLLFLSVHLLSAFPSQSGTITKEDVDVLKLLLDRLEEAFPAPMDDQPQPSELPKLAASGLSEEQGRPRPQPDARDYLSARDLKNLRLDSGSKRYSSCFGRRLDRIGSMSSLGCNTIGRNNPKRR